MNVGCSPYYPPPAAVGNLPFGYPAYGGYPSTALAGPVSWDIVGVDPAAPGTEKTMTDKAKDFLNQPTVGVKNGYWLAGAATLGVVWYGYSAGWFGKKKK